jgi:hypothetical protein
MTSHFAENDLQNKSNMMIAFFILWVYIDYFPGYYLSYSPFLAGSYEDAGNPLMHYILFFWLVLFI